MDMKIKPIEKRNPKPPKYLYIGSHPSPEKRLFVLLCMLGYSRGEAYQTAINPDIKASSAAVAGCNLLKQKDVQRIAKHLIEAYANGEWELNVDILRPDVIDV